MNKDTTIPVLVAVMVALAAFAATLLLAEPTPAEYDRYEVFLSGNGVENPALLVEESLKRAGYLPVIGTQMERRNGFLEWETSSRPAALVTGVEAQQVRLSPTANLLRTVLDDDPTYIADVVVRVDMSPLKKGRLAHRQVDCYLYIDDGILSPSFCRSRACDVS